MNNSTTVDLKDENYESLDTAIKWIKPSELNEGDVIKGTLLEIKTGDFGLTYILQTDDGGLEGLNGCGALDKQFKAWGPSIGRSFKIAYGGMQQIDSGNMAGKSFHVFDVQRLKASVAQ